MILIVSLMQASSVRASKRAPIGTAIAIAAIARITTRKRISKAVLGTIIKSIGLNCCVVESGRLRRHLYKNMDRRPIDIRGIRRLEELLNNHDN